KKNTWLRNAKCFILESVPTTNTLVLHLKSESKGIVLGSIYSGLTKIRTRRRAADSTNSTEPIHLVLQHLRESFSLS
ncbi:hypothetical protein, partial [Neisseria meningitidis]|uniref:hypothetical protein n=1 Tax=Neisseria meningitidis TaxID=487 RepID=UPI002F357D3C